MLRCPITETTKSTINSVKKVFEDNIHVTFDEIEVETLVRDFS